MVSDVSEVFLLYIVISNAYLYDDHVKHLIDRNNNRLILH